MPLTDADVAVSAASDGAAVVRSRYGGELTRFAKSATDFATDADVDAERAVIAVLRAERPDDPVLGEESGTHAGTGAAASERFWLVDPLCGTLNFAARTPLAVVNVALRDGSRIGAAACADPVAGELFWTDGRQAWRRAGSEQPHAADEPLQPSAGSGLVELNIDPPYPNVARFEVAGLLSNTVFVGAFRPRVLSTALALVWVAAGRRAAYVTDGDVRDSVHFSAGIGVCQAAGCVVTGLLGQPLHTGVGGLVVAADAGTHHVLVDIIRAEFG